MITSGQWSIEVRAGTPAVALDGSEWTATIAPPCSKGCLAFSPLLGALTRRASNELRWRRFRRDEHAEQRVEDGFRRCDGAREAVDVRGEALGVETDVIGVAEEVAEAQELIPVAFGLDGEHGRTDPRERQRRVGEQGAVPGVAGALR